MNSLLASYVQLPKPLQAVLTVAATGSVTAAIVLALTGYGGVALIIVVGLALLALLLAGYRAILKWRQSAKANPFMREIAESTAAVPQGAAAASRARLDDMRKRFEKGLTTFKAHGKNIYSLPWYVIVGEPGSGKTELIRHCKIGFPPGLQDELQGVGGTVNMDWWFTDHAVILDTAGRLILEDVESTSTSEWKEFLKLLARHRPNCPINGLLLAVPADSLIKDNSETIERKAKRISRQLDEIQRTLGVRFPVFIVITKADLVNGFREFFEDVGEPQFQDQMFGWSNPAPLDDEFKPEQIERHVDSIRTRLMRRRLAVMRDPVHTEDQNGRRIDQVDSLFAFPDSLKSLGPRLRRYLELIFAGGTWATKPLFLRGIYFASSMREGDELDEELAKLHGMSVDALGAAATGAGRGSWARDKAYFIRDLFLNKVFREKGLVTRATNTKSLQKRRRAALLATSGGGMALALLLTILGAWQLNQSVLAPTKHWQHLHQFAADKNRYGDPDPSFPIVHPHPQTKAATYYGDEIIDELDATVLETIARVRHLAEEPIKVHAIFVPVNRGRELLRQQRVDAARAFFEMSVLKPLTEQSRAKLAKEQDWNALASEALAHVVRFDVAAAGHAAMSQPELAPLFAYLLREKAPPADHIQQLQSMSDWLYAPEQSGQWPPPFASADARTNAESVKTAVRLFVESAHGDTANEHTVIGQITQLAASLNQFCAAEWQLLRLDENARPEDPKPSIDAWNAPFAALASASSEIQNRSAALNGRSLQQAYEDERRKIAASYDAILNELAPTLESAKDGGVAGATTSLTDARKQLDDAQKKLRAADSADTRIEEYAFLDKALLARIGADGPAAWECRWQVYQTLHGELVDFKPEISDWLQVSSLKDSIASRAKSAQAAESVRRLRLNTPTTSQPPEPLANNPCQARQSSQNAQALALFDYTLAWAGERQAVSLLEACLATMPENASGIDDSVQALHGKTSTSDPSPRFPKVELTKLNSEQERLIEVRYWPESAAAVFDSWMAIKEFHDAQPAAHQKRVETLMQSRQHVLTEYVRNYLTYWTVTVAEKASVDPTQLATWSDLCKSLPSLQEVFVNKSLDEVVRTATRAVKGVESIKASLGKEEQDLVKNTIESLGEEARRLENSKFNADCNDVRKRWMSVCDRGELATTELLKRGRSDIEQYYLQLYTEEAEQRAGNRQKWFQSGGYWGQLSIRALQLLVNHTTSQCKEALERLVHQDHKRFPLCLSGPSVNRPPANAMLASAQFGEAKRHFTQVQKSRPSALRGADSSQARASTINSLLDRLEGRDLHKLNSSLYPKLEQVFSIAEQPCTFVLLPRAYQFDNVPQFPGLSLDQVVNERPYMEVTSSKGKFKNRNARDRIQSDNPADLLTEPPHEPQFAIPGTELRIEFFASDDPAAQSDRFAVLPGDWPALWALHAPGAKFDEKAQIWQVPLVVEGSNGPTNYYWIGLKFDKPISPELVKSWPTLEDWRMAGVP